MASPNRVSQALHQSALAQANTAALKDLELFFNPHMNPSIATIEMVVHKALEDVYQKRLKKEKTPVRLPPTNPDSAIFDQQMALLRKAKSGQLAELNPKELISALKLGETLERCKAEEETNLPIAVQRPLAEFKSGVLSSLAKYAQIKLTEQLRSTLKDFLEGAAYDMELQLDEMKDWVERNDGHYTVASYKTIGPYAFYTKVRNLLDYAEAFANGENGVDLDDMRKQSNLPQNFSPTYTDYSQKGPPWVVKNSPMISRIEAIGELVNEIQYMWQKRAEGSTADIWSKKSDTFYVDILPLLNQLEQVEAISRAPARALP